MGISVLASNIIKITGKRKNKFSKNSMIKYLLRIVVFIFLIVIKLNFFGNSVHAQLIYDFKDVHVLKSVNPQSEVHISISPNNSNNLILSCNSYPGFYSQGYFFSSDGGNTWGGSESLQGLSTVGGDPSTAFDGNGNSYLSTLNSFGNAILMQSSNDGGINWNNIGSPIFNESGTDKEMISCDNYYSSPYLNNLYCGWTFFYDSNNDMHVMIDRSINSGQLFGSLSTLNRNGQGVNIQTAPNGNVYAVWADFGTTSPPSSPASGIGFSLSTNGGYSFSPPVIAFNYTGIAIYSRQPDPRFNNIGINDFPSMDVDRSNTHNGRIYVVYPEEVNGKAVIQLQYSDNQGTNWSGPITVSNINFQQSFFPWISVDDTNGDIYIVYYAFDQPTGFSTNTYVAYSNNGASSFQNIKVSDVPFTAQAINNTIFRLGYMGDYIGIVAHCDKAWATWMDNRNGYWQIYVSKVAPIPILSSSSSSWECSYMSTIYYVAPYPNAISYTWTTTNGLKINGSSSPFTTSSTSVTISNQNDNNLSGQASVVANFSCGTSYPDSLPFNGTPNFTPTYKVICPSNPYNADSSTTPYIAAGPLLVYFYSIPSNLRISAYRWYIDYSTSYIQTSTNNLPYPTTGTHAVSVSIDTQCGWSLQTLWQQVTLCSSSPTMSTYTETTASLKSKGILSKNEEYIIYPNPVNSSLQIEDKKGNPLGLIKFYDSQGRLIKQMQTGSSYISMPLYNLADGLYILKIVNKNLIPFTKKIMINK